MSATAVLYVCAERRPGPQSLDEVRTAAEREGRALADQHDLRIVAMVTDPYGEPDPQRRSGWMRVRELAERNEVSTVITRWPDALSPRHEMRYLEVDYLRQNRCQVLYSWQPLAALVGGGATPVNGWPNREGR
ncbi:hypothetical protein [Streptomyces chattanoogensis]|uniref:hypothetical protein n=1 Tax=Streptomyces chattanoogensis TaxID=66876 RepID=UPI00369AE8C1